jgi:hypothetical protein
MSPDIDLPLGGAPVATVQANINGHTATQRQ